MEPEAPVEVPDGPRAVEVGAGGDEEGRQRDGSAPRDGDVLVAIPAYNEELAISGLVLQARDHADEVLVVDDASTDDTVRLARRAGARVLVNDGNRGKGFSVRRAFRYAEASGVDCLVLMDGDGQHDPGEIPDLVEPVLGRSPPEGGENGQAGGSNGEGPDPKDIALGFRVGGTSEMPAWRRVGKRVLDYATATAAGTTEMLTDSQCGFRAFGPRAIDAMADRLTDDDFGIESEQLVVAREAGLSMENVQIHCRYEDIEDTSTKGPVAHGMGVLEDIIDLVANRRPLLFIGVPSVLLMVAGGGLGIYTIQLWTWTNYWSMAYSLGAATMILLGMLGVMSSLILNLVGSFEKKVERIVRGEAG